MKTMTASSVRLNILHCIIYGTPYKLNNKQARWILLLQTIMNRELLLTDDDNRGHVHDYIHTKLHQPSPAQLCSDWLTSFISGDALADTRQITLVCMLIVLFLHWTQHNAYYV